MLDRSSRDLGRFEALRKRLSPTDQTSISGNFNERRRARCDPPLRESKWLGQRALEDMGSNSGNFHNSDVLCVVGGVD